MTDPEKLRTYEAMRADIQKRYDELLNTLAQLKAEGKTKTVTYRESMGWKYHYKALLDLYAQYGL